MNKHQSRLIETMNARKKREEQLANIFLNNEMELTKKNSTIFQVMIDRLKSNKIAVFDYTDEYTREWFKSTYHLNKNLKLDRLNITTETMVNYLKKVSK